MLILALSLHALSINDCHKKALVKALCSFMPLIRWEEMMSLSFWSPRTKLLGTLWRQTNYMYYICPRWPSRPIRSLWYIVTCTRIRASWQSKCCEQYVILARLLLITELSPTWCQLYMKAQDFVSVFSQRSGNVVSLLTPRKLFCCCFLALVTVHSSHPVNCTTTLDDGILSTSFMSFISSLDFSMAIAWCIRRMNSLI